MEEALESVRGLLDKIPYLSKLEAMVGRGKRKASHAGISLVIIALSALLVVALIASTWEHVFGSDVDKSGHAQSIQFLFKDNASREEAERLCRDDGGRISTADEVQHAWEFHGAHSFAFGRLADDRFSVTVQDDFPNYQRGPNIGAVGGNQGVWCTFDD